MQSAGGDNDSLARHTDCYARAVTLHTCLTGQTNEGLGQFPQLPRGSPFSKEPSVLFFFVPPLRGGGGRLIPECSGSGAVVSGR